MSRSTANSLVTQLVEARDRDILNARAWAIHADGDALICEAKLNLQGGMTEDADAKLNQARERLIEAAQEAPDELWHLRCRSYAEFLLRRSADAEATLQIVFLQENLDWLQEEWDVFKMFSLPEDKQFQMFLERWRELRTPEAAEDEGRN